MPNGARIAVVPAAPSAAAIFVPKYTIIPTATMLITAAANPTANPALTVSEPSRKFVMTIANPAHNVNICQNLFVLQYNILELIEPQ